MTNSQKYVIIITVIVFIVRKLSVMFYIYQEMQ